MRRAWNHALSQARARRRRRWASVFFGVFVFGPWPARSQCRICRHLDFFSAKSFSLRGTRIFFAGVRKYHHPPLAVSLSVISSFSLVPGIQAHHTGSGLNLGRDLAGRKRSGAGAVKAGWSCSWLRTGLSCPFRTFSCKKKAKKKKKSPTTDQRPRNAAQSPEAQLRWRSTGCWVAV